MSAAESDCNADIYISRKNPVDDKHKFTRIHALSIIKSLGASKPVILCGHSLGGSLAMNAFIATQENKEPIFDELRKKVFYVGFNAALLSNWDNSLERLIQDNVQWQYQAIHHRITRDLVSVGTGFGLGK